MYFPKELGRAARAFDGKLRGDRLSLSPSLPLPLSLSAALRTLSLQGGGGSVTHPPGADREGRSVCGGGEPPDTPRSKPAGPARPAPSGPGRTRPARPWPWAGGCSAPGPPCRRAEGPAVRGAGSEGLGDAAAIFTPPDSKALPARPALRPHPRRRRTDAPFLPQTHPAFAFRRPDAALRAPRGPPLSPAPPALATAKRGQGGGGGGGGGGPASPRRRGTGPRSSRCCARIVTGVTSRESRRDRSAQR